MTRTLVGRALLLLALGGVGASHPAVTALRAQAPAPPTLVLLANQPAFGPGATLSVTLGLRHAGPPLAADVYFGAILPDGDSVVFFEGLGLATGQGRLSQLASLRPMLAGLGIATGTDIVVPGFFHYAWQGHEPLGAYQLFFAATTPGALRDGQLQGGELLALETQSVLNLPRATVTTDAAHAGSGVVGRAGGTVTATAADGTVYRLVVPAGALTTDTPITLTPVVGLAGLPVPVTIAAGVHGAPSGLQFTVPATLQVDLPQPLDGDVVGMPLPDSGAGFRLEPVIRGGNRLEMRVDHFSVLAIPRILPDLVNLMAPTSAYARAVQLTVRATRSETLADVEAARDFLATWFDADLFRQFVAASGPASDDVRLAALADFQRWEERRVVLEMIFAEFFPSIRGSLTARATAGRQMALSVLGDGYEFWNRDCLVSTRPVAERLASADRGAGYAILSEPYLHYLERVQSLDPIVSQAATPGGTRPLRVKAGAALGGAPVSFGSFMKVYFHPSPADRATARATTNAVGEAFFPVTADGNGNLAYKICAFFDDAQFPSGLAIVRLVFDGAEACRVAVSGVVVTPSQVTIAQGASQRFTAVVEGTTNQVVTWSVGGGGSITATGLFTSDGTPGTFFVQAVSQEDPSSVGIAQITVEAPACAETPCTFTGMFEFCEGPNCTTFPSGTFYTHPEVQVSPTGQAGILSWNQLANNCPVIIPFDLGSSGAMSSGPRSSVCMSIRSLTGTFSGQSLTFRLVEWFQGYVITFTGSRVP